MKLDFSLHLPLHGLCVMHLSFSLFVVAATTALYTCIRNLYMAMILHMENY